MGVLEATPGLRGSAEKLLTPDQFDNPFLCHGITRGGPEDHVSARRTSGRLKWQPGRHRLQRCGDDGNDGPAFVPALRL